MRRHRWIGYELSHALSKISVVLKTAETWEPSKHYIYTSTVKGNEILIFPITSRRLTAPRGSDELGETGQKFFEILERKEIFDFCDESALFRDE